MKYILKLSYLSIAVLIMSSCTCDDIHCEGFDRNYSSWLVYQNPETLTFTDNTTDITLSINDKSISEPYTEEVKWSSLGGCKPVDCSQRASTRGQFNTTINGFNYGRISIDNHDRPDFLRLSISVFDFHNAFTIKPQLELEGTLQSFHNTINLNGINYKDVISMELDTLSIYNKNKHIWKVYFSEEKGIIAFSDRNTHKTYYLKP